MTTQDENLAIDRIDMGNQAELGAISIKELLAKLDTSKIKMAKLQRKEVWPPKQQRLFIDTIGRGLPIGMITLHEQEEGRQKYKYIIDGQQRVTTIKNFVRGVGPFKGNGPATPSFKAETRQYEEDTTNDFTKDLWNSRMKWNSLDPNTKDEIFSFKIPTLTWDAKPEQLTLAFDRMNTMGVALIPSEIRHAIFFEKPIYQALENLSSDLPTHAQTLKRFFEWLDLSKPNQPEQTGNKDATSYQRYGDIEFLTEYLAIEVEKGPTNRRDELTPVLQKNYSDRDISKHISALKKNLLVVKQIYPNGLKTANLMSPKDMQENIYAIMAALYEQPISQAQINANGLDLLKEALEEFNRLVSLFIEDPDKPELNYDPNGKQDVKGYANSIRGGQTNGRRNREKRRDIILKFIQDQFVPIDSINISGPVRNIVWLRSENKQCYKCGAVVSWDDYHCSHYPNHRALGGSRELSNLRVGHKQCNLQDRPS